MVYRGFFKGLGFHLGFIGVEGGRGRGFCKCFGLWVEG